MSSAAIDDSLYGWTAYTIYRTVRETSTNQQALCSITGMYPKHGQGPSHGIDKIFDNDVKTFWHGTKLDSNYSSAFKMKFKVIIILYNKNW